jgi:mediator of RNA polymerase II transcription subunit 7
LNRALLFNFLEFLDALVTEAPEGRAKVDQKIEDIQLVVINMHHIINTHRPHQSRQILIATMTEQINRRLQTVTEIERLLSISSSILCPTLPVFPHL